jgi:hypothetical protein
VARTSYHADPDKKKAASRAMYKVHPLKKNIADRAAYRDNADKRKAAAILVYDVNPQQKRAATKAAYKANPEKTKALFREYHASHRSARLAAFQEYHASHRSTRLRYFRKYHTHTKLKRVTKAKYSLALPNQLTIEQCYRSVNANLLADGKVLLKLKEEFKSLHAGVADTLSRAELEKTVGRLAVKRLVCKALQIRRKHAGFLLASIKLIKSITLKEHIDFGKGCHTSLTEPYFYEAAYLHVRESPIPVNEKGECIVAKEVPMEAGSKNEEGKDAASNSNLSQAGSVGCVSDGKVSDKGPAQSKMWECSKQCKPLSEFEVNAIVCFRTAFEQPVEKVRQALAECDMGCPYSRYTKLVDTAPVDLRGHPIVCYSGECCTSTLRILRAASTHFPVLRRFLAHVTSALSAHRIVRDIDNALKNGNHQRLLQITQVESLLSCNVEQNYQKLIPVQCSALRRPNLEMELAIAHAALIAGFEKEIDDFPEHACICCERLHQRKSVSVVSLSDDFNSEIWHQLKAHILKYPPTVSGKVLYMCYYCKRRVRAGIMPARCVLNGLQTVPIPPELAALDLLSRQLIQRAKCYQTVVRLGTYTGKVPRYNSLQACKGTMFFLPLPLNKTIETLNKVQQHTSLLPDPELYIIVNGRPTKSNVVWRSLVDVNHVKTAIRKLRSCNWLYRDVHEKCIDESTKHIIEVSNNATTEMLKKVSPDEVDGFQAYTIRNLDSKLSIGSDLEQYRLMSITEDPITNKQQHLDVMCFPVLFPTGKFGEFHPRKEKISPSEYVKSRLLNKDSRFRKDAQYVFYLLWQKEMRQLASGVYNLLKSTRRQSMSVNMLLEQVNTADEQLEARLCTMLQSVRGTKQFWFLRHSELKCMIREWGSPTLFLTFSCAEYESPDITEFLRKVNNVPPSYNIGKLCVEDPISVSRKFSLKFHAFFRKVILKGQVLGIVDHFYWKKEYQNRGAPHYHVLLWIRDAPLIDRDDPEKVLDWIQDRITCHIPDEQGSPELHRLVTRYQMHKCSKYCKRRKRCGKTAFITRCRFGFPRPVCETAQLNPVQESLKSRNRIYQLVRTLAETRVNDYNPLLLMLWKANIDIQFVAEASLALAHYVSGYVTKAERSNMQDIWQEVSENKSIYSRLFSFGVRSLRFRECGLYEASDLLLGDHLTEKSDTVKWVDVSMPHKRSRRLKNHKVLQEMARLNPDSQNIFEDNVLDTFYPQRPALLESVCLYDFVANYEFQGIDTNGQRVYKKLSKPKLPNHKIFDPENENQKQDYFYSLVLLFSPFRDESSLLQGNETAEQAFHRLLTSQSSSYHSKLRTVLAAASNVKSINEARQANMEEKEAKEDNEPQLLGEARTAMTEVLDMKASTPGQLTLNERVSMLNQDQKRVFENVKAHFLHQKCHEAKQCLCDFAPLRSFVSGVGGTGKSFLIEAIKALVNSLWNSEGLLCGIAAPTGLAAFNVGGITIHRLFQLPVEHATKATSYWPLPKTSQKIMRATLSEVKLFIIDEISMVSSINLAFVHMRLEELFGSSEWFGSRNMLFVGDLLQLPPVHGNPVFEKVATKSILSQLGCAAAINIWRDCVTYDELTINERQKSDPQFSSMLDCVRRGCPTKETVSVLKQRVIQVSVSDKFSELKQSGKAPVCLFPKRKACDYLNAQMLRNNASEVHDIYCTDEIDETAGNRKMTKKIIEHLDKLNADCNMTAGLEAKLSLAVGARVMLRRNIDTKAGLVNGAIGTVLSIAAQHVTVQFDNVPAPCKIDKVRSRFMVMKNFYVYRRQFPLILAYAITIHKCQGLSLDCAIVDLSEEVFSDGMAYVALSRVRSLDGLFLTAFDPQSISVSVSSLEEVNRLRKTHRPDLPLYDIPHISKRKRKLTGVDKTVSPSVKKVKVNPSSARDNEDCVITGTETPAATPFNFHSVDVQWQQSACQELGLQYCTQTPVRPGGPAVPLTRPDMRSVRRVQGDGNCLFRAFSYILTGSADQHIGVRHAILDHMTNNAQYFLGHHLIGYGSIQSYIASTGMDQDRAWGTDIEMLSLAHLLQTPVFSYSQQHGQWQRYSPHDVDRQLMDDIHQRSMYLLHTGNHFNVVGSIRKS